MAVEKAVSQDQSVLWALPLSAAEIKDRFKLTTALKHRAAQLRQQSEGAHVVKTMPAVLAGRTMSAFMKDGSPLCAAFQQGRCGRDPELCKGKHKCAAVLKSGRVCGGNHPGQECRDHRVIRQADQGEVRPTAKQQPKPPEPPGPPPKKAKKAAVTLPTATQPSTTLTEEEQAMETKLDRWATNRGKTAQRPSPIREVPCGCQASQPRTPWATFHRFPFKSLASTSPCRTKEAWPSLRRCRWQWPRLPERTGNHNGGWHGQWSNRRCKAARACLCTV